MNKKEKQLLLKDLCARLPHGVHCCVFRLNENIKENDDILYGVIGDNVITLKCDEDECLMYYQIKPYLRPMSSMTKEEKKEFDKVLKSCNNKVFACPDKERRYNFFDAEQEDFMNAHHFDYRGLIPMGLALEAPEDMYKTKE